MSRVAAPVETLCVTPAAVCEAHLSAAVRKRDLAIVEMAREHEVVRAGSEPVNDVRVVAEQDAEIGVGVRASRSGLARRRRGTRSGRLPRSARVRPRSSSSTASSRSSGAGSSSSSLHGCGERVARDRRSRGCRAPRTSARPRRAAARGSFGSPRGCVSRSPVSATRSGRRSSTHSTARSTARDAAGRDAEMEVGEVRDPQPVELGRQPGHLTSSSRSRTQPASNQPQPSRRSAPPRARRGDQRPPRRSPPPPTIRCRRAGLALRLRASRAPAADRRRGA